mmetsp:Transcript_6125/g.14218  ORF Transcript_6125/g.14218 Transcript_6125/m.14218 type:complete len:274 (-) Transcript_6125:62-883(-)
MHYRNHQQASERAKSDYSTKTRRKSLNNCAYHYYRRLVLNQRLFAETVVEGVVPATIRGRDGVYAISRLVGPCSIPSGCWCVSSLVGFQVHVAGRSSGLRLWPRCRHLSRVAHVRADFQFMCLCTRVRTSESAIQYEVACRHCPGHDAGDVSQNLLPHTIIGHVHNVASQPEVEKCQEQPVQEVLLLQTEPQRLVPFVLQEAPCTACEDAEQSLTKPMAESPKSRSGRLHEDPDRLQGEDEARQSAEDPQSQLDGVCTPCIHLAGHCYISMLW